MSFIPDSIETYVQKHTSAESPAVRWVVQQSEKELTYTDMISGRVVGQLLAMLTTISGAKKILEIGTFTGYSALRMAEALPEEGILITCEYNERYEAIAREAFKESNVGNKISLKMGPALETIESIHESFDIIFLDADKNNYPNYYRRLLPKLSIGGLMVIDNVLWGGEVLVPESNKAQAIHTLNEIIVRDECVEQVLLTIRDGLTVLRRLS